MVKVILIIISIILTTYSSLKINNKFQYKFCKKLVEICLWQFNNLEEDEDEKNELIGNFYRACFPFRINIIYLIPIVNIVYSIIKGLYFNFSQNKINSIRNSTDEDVLEAIRCCQGIDFDKEDDEEEFVLDEGILYFVRFEKNNKYNNIWFTFVNHELIIDSISGEVINLSDNEQKLIVLTILKDISEGKESEYGYRDIVLELVDSYDFFVDTNSVNEPVIKRVRKKF